MKREELKKATYAKADRAVPPQSKQRQARPAFVVFAAKLNTSCTTTSGKHGGQRGSFSTQKPHVFQEYTDIRPFFSKTCKKVVAFP